MITPVTAAAVTGAARRRRRPVAGEPGRAQRHASPSTSPARYADPGIAVLDAGARVVDALEAAGGARAGVDLSGLNLARVLVDGEQIAGRGPGARRGRGRRGGRARRPAGPLVNLNTATQAELETLPEVGPVTAQAILSWRDEHGGFTAVDELLEVDGIGDATLAQLAPLRHGVTCGADARRRPLGPRPADAAARRRRLGRRRSPGAGPAGGCRRSPPGWSLVARRGRPVPCRSAPGRGRGGAWCWRRSAAVTTLRADQVDAEPGGPAGRRRRGRPGASAPSPPTRARPRAGSATGRAGPARRPRGDRPGRDLRAGGAGARPRPTATGSTSGSAPRCARPAGSRPADDDDLAAVLGARGPPEVVGAPGRVVAGRRRGAGVDPRRRSRTGRTTSGRWCRPWSTATTPASTRRSPTTSGPPG